VSEQQWTEPEFVAALRRHLSYWQGKLRLLDIDIEVRIVDSLPRNYWLATSIGNGASNPNKAVLEVRRSSIADTTEHELWSVAAHELVHVVLWPMKRVPMRMESQLSTAQHNALCEQLDSGNEDIAYKFEALLTWWFSDDMPGQRQLPLGLAPSGMTQKD
jgi:hypothetical protein